MFNILKIFFIVRSYQVGFVLYVIERDFIFIPHFVIPFMSDLLLPITLEGAYLLLLLICIVEDVVTPYPVLYLSLLSKNPTSV